MIRYHASQIAWQLDDTENQMLPKMQTDIMLSKGNNILIIDAKYYSHMTQGKNVTISRVYSDADMTVNTYTDDKNRTQSAGFIGNLTGKSSVEYVFAAGKVDNKTSEQLYNFIGTPDALKTMVKNSFVIQNAGGVSNITDGVGQEILREVTSQEAATSDFYKTSMTLNEETWNLSLVPMKGYPELKGMEKREVISVKTAEDFMKMKDFPTQEYRLNVVKSEMEQVLISMAASNPQYPVNTTNKAAELMVEENLIANGYLKDFLYAYNYIDRWYDFQIGGINIRDVPYVDGGTPNAQTFRRNGYELGGLYGYSDGLVEYLSNRTQTGDLAYFKKKMQPLKYCRIFHIKAPPFLTESLQFPDKADKYPTIPCAFRFLRSARRQLLISGLRQELC